MEPTREAADAVSKLRRLITEQSDDTHEVQYCWIGENEWHPIRDLDVKADGPLMRIEQCKDGTVLSVRLFHPSQLTIHLRQVPKRGEKAA